MEARIPPPFVTAKSVFLEKLENLFNQFAIKNVEKNIVYDELKSLDITIIESQDSYKNKLKRLFSVLLQSKKI
ncbi:hypothetical protein [Staphylococcus aureus]|uniref:hypothetical protein n=1 Tax=Staphylococcus aureus TaxID=1280 RepID=UPI000BA7A332|nr:hypothetical protein [Staphylococcus aureus]